MSRLHAHPESHLMERIGWPGRERRHRLNVAGVVGLVAGAMSMAAGEYVSVSSQSDTEQADLARERKELAENIEFERESSHLAPADRSRRH